MEREGHHPNPDLCWDDHPERIVIGRHRFERLYAAEASSMETTRYRYDCACCKQVVYGKYVYDDDSRTSYHFYIITPLDALNA